MSKLKAVFGWLNRQLGLRIVIAGILASVAISSLLALFQLMSVISTQHQFIANDISTLANKYQNELSTAIEQGDTAAAQIILEKVSPIVFVTSSSLIDSTGELITAFDKNNNFDPKHHSRLVNLTRDPIKTFQTDVYSNSQPQKLLGTLSIEYDVRLHVSRRIAVIKQNSLILIMEGVLVTLLLVFLYYRYLTKPLVELSQQIRESSVQHRGKKVGKPYLHRDDELGMVVNEINDFLSLVQKTLNEKEMAVTEAEKSTRSLSELIESLPHFISVKSSEGKLLLANQAYLNAFNINPKDYVGIDEASYFTEVPSASRSIIKDADQEVLDTLSPIVLPEIDWSFTDGTYIALEIRKTTIAYKGEKAILTVAVDVTERKEHQAKVQYLAYHDSLTDLPNRHLFLDRLDQALLRSERSRLYGALIFFDLDNFKHYNDSKGHLFGDEILVRVANSLKEIVRGQDTVARLGGDEFVICMTELSKDEEEAKDIGTELSNRVLVNLRTPFQLENVQVNISASLGIVFFNNCNQSASELLKHADMAMYKAKDAGRDKVIVFEDRMAEANIRLKELKRDCKTALKEDQFFLVYQPQVHTVENKIIGAEALIRWRHPVRGTISPAEFIPILEESGLMPAVGEWVINKAVEDAAKWHKQKLVIDDFKMSVNVSPQQFREENFEHTVKDIIDLHKVHAPLINLEITESMIIDDIERMANSMNKLKDIGINFSIDDFGTGYSNLNYLKKLPLDVIKIDQSFVRDILTDQNSLAIVQTILAMAAQLNLTTIAEGVETEEQFDEIRKMGCLVYQGYLYSPPVEADKFLQLLSK